MKGRLLPLVVLVLMTACTQLPRIYPQPDRAGLNPPPVCRNLFPQGRWQLYHTIKATVPGGQRSELAGVSVVSSRERSIQWALMTVEGFVLFSGRYDGNLTVDRAIPPFDRPGFAEGLTADLMLLYFPPQAPLIASGRLEEGGRVCRYGEPERDTIDIVVRDGRTWEVRQYSANQRLIRSIVAAEITTVAGNPFARSLILKNHGMAGYRLELSLVEAVPLSK